MPLSPDLTHLLSRSPLEVAPHLLGATITSQDLAAGAESAVSIRLTEVEAYAGADDPASHAFRGQTARNASMFGPSSTIYIYFIYGMHFCVNIVCGNEGEAGAVLLRAGEITAGEANARQRRPAARNSWDLARGPARLCAALGLNREDDGTRLGGPGSRLTLTLPAEEIPSDRICTGPRVGVPGLGADEVRFPWRFWIDGDPTVSPYRPARPRRK
ncbi:MAG: DNA-3-methyladenine glycosylase [Actinomycetaceae bacterium]|nr:DNA-3-methyladenine glycosylase [Actinomycetaceae bacterium]